MDFYQRNLSQEESLSSAFNVDISESKDASLVTILVQEIGHALKREQKKMQNGVINVE